MLIGVVNLIRLTCSPGVLVVTGVGVDKWDSSCCGRISVSAASSQALEWRGSSPEVVVDELVLRRGAAGVFLVPDAAAPGAVTLRMGRTDQSYVDPDDPLKLEFDYVQRLADVVDVIAPAGQRIRVVHVGGALMTLPRYITATRPSSAQIVLEPDTELTEFVRRHVPLPKRSGIKVRGADGREGMAALRDNYTDLVIIDAFDGSQVPAGLTTIEFFDEVARVTDDGVLLINITDHGELRYTRRVLAGVTTVFPQVLLCAEPSTLKGRRFGNIVIAAAGRGLPADELAGRATQSAFGYRVVVEQRLRQMIGGAVPFTDADSSVSPAAPATLFR